MFQCGPLSVGKIRERILQSLEIRHVSEELARVYKVFVDIVEVGKEKPISYKKAASVLQSFITVNGGNENDTFDESRIVKLIHMHSPHSWMISNLSS